MILQTKVKQWYVTLRASDTDNRCMWSGQYETWTRDSGTTARSTLALLCRCCCCCVVVVVFIVVVGVAVVKWNGLASMRSGQWDSCEADLGLPCVGPGRLHWQVSRPPEAHPSAPLAFKPSSWPKSTQCHIFESGEEEMKSSKTHSSLFWSARKL